MLENVYYVTLWLVNLFAVSYFYEVPEIMVRAWVL